MSTRKGGLGRGLDALIPQSVIPTEIKTSSGVITANRDEIELSNISANPKQPRTNFDEDQLTELALSIKEVGLLQPPVDQLEMVSINLLWVSAAFGQQSLQD